MNDGEWIVRFITYLVCMFVCGVVIFLILWNGLHNCGWNWNCLILFTGLFVVFSRLYDKLFVEE